MAGQADIVAKVISDPLAVYQSPRYLNRQLFYRSSELAPPFNRGYMRVVVEFRKRRWKAELAGILITAYPVAAPDPDEVMIWPTN